MARPVSFRPGLARQDKARFHFIEARRCATRRGGARHGVAGRGSARHGSSGPGNTRQGFSLLKQGTSLLGQLWQVRARQGQVR